MARSQQSWQKKEREKKKQKKRKEKEKKREERKSNTSTNDLDEMIAYVDEFGNITDTPPDEEDKEEVDPEEIEVSVPTKEESDEEDGQHTGTIVYFNDSKGYGFIRDDASRDSIFVHANEADEPLQQNDKVTYMIEKGPKGLNAVSVQRVK